MEKKRRVESLERLSEAQESWTVDIAWLNDAEYSDLLRGMPGLGEDPRDDAAGERSRRLMQVAIAREICLRKGLKFDRAVFDENSNDELNRFCKENAECADHGKMRLKIEEVLP